MGRTKEACAAFAIRNRASGLCGCGRARGLRSVTCPICSEGNRQRMICIRRQRVHDGCCPECGVPCVGYRCPTHNAQHRKYRKSASPPPAFEASSPPGELVKVFGVAPWALTAACPQYEDSALLGVHPDDEERDPDRFFDVRALPWGLGSRAPFSVFDERNL